MNIDGTAGFSGPTYSNESPCHVERTLIFYHFLQKGVYRLEFNERRNVKPAVVLLTRVDFTDAGGRSTFLLTAVTTLAQATDLIQNVVASKLAKSMMISIDEIDVNRPVSSYGVDSLVAAEMRNWCFRDLKADISVFELLSGNSITILAGQIVNKSILVPQVIEREKGA